MNLPRNGFRSLILMPVVLCGVSLAQSSSTDAGSPTPIPTGMNTPGASSNQTSPGVSRPRPGSTNLGMDSAIGGADNDVSSIKEKLFLADAAQGGMSEIAMGNLAAAKGSDPRVKQYGSKMVADHTMLNEKMMPFAKKFAVTPPSGLKPADQAELDKLKELSGADFDREYVSYMMKDHAEDLKDFRKESALAGDPKLKMTVIQGMKVIAMHKKMIDELGSSMGLSPTH